MNRKFFIFIMLCCSVSFNITANANEGISVNGYDWMSYKNDEKIAFVYGWIKCGMEASDNLLILVKKWNESTEYVKKTQTTFMNQGILLGGVTIGQVIETIDETYKDARLKSIDIAEIMPLVNGRLKSGWTSEDFDKAIALTAKLYHCEKQYGFLAKECVAVRKEKNLFFKR